MAFNRLSGSLLENSFESYPLNSSIDFHYNRLSGDIAPRLTEITSVDILEGNVFVCVEPPNNDKNHNTYSCGSSTVNFYQIIYFGIGMLLICFALFVWLRVKFCERYQGGLFAHIVFSKCREAVSKPNVQHFV